MTRAVIFDYFGVISSDEYWDFVGTDKDLTSDWLNLANRVNLGRLGWQEFLQGLADKTGKSMAEVKAVYEQEMLNPQLIALIRELKDHYKIGLLTNAHHDFIEPILKRSHIEDLFDVVTVSSRVGAVKPDRKIYEVCLGELGVNPDEVIFIDDIERNVAGAEALGICGIHYSNIEGLKSELAAALSA